MTIPHCLAPDGQQAVELQLPLEVPGIPTVDIQRGVGQRPSWRRLGSCCRDHPQIEPLPVHQSIESPEKPPTASKPVRPQLPLHMLERPQHLLQPRNGVRSDPSDRGPIPGPMLGLMLSPIPGLMRGQIRGPIPQVRSQVRSQVRC
eukprot:CAMPEP_0114147586 /NCGR_PEP_ID=MMETSP0043_2-20121206/21176_1 /TAXON_ID=464988 /ORGANISM="Hemiselmis andersenii, Strain CCMP644" /LENGTH=145 /DNA_ID=CAMNT_0001242115 /DNA_START=393 /DNA_END=830 /DNA_ORIENTATION=+